MPPSDPRDTRTNRIIQLVESHPFSSFFAALGLIVLACALVYAFGRGDAPAGTLRAWGGSTLTPANKTAYIPSAPAFSNDSDADVANATDTAALALPLGSSPLSQKTASNADYAALISSIMLRSSLSTDTASSSADPRIAQLVTYFPALALSSSAQKARTSEQQALFDYGNAAGAIIKAYDASHTDALAIVSAHAADRSSSTKGAALHTLANAISKIGTDLRAIPEIPASARSEHDALAHSYEDAGQKLALLSETTSDQTFLSAMNAYNASVDTLTQNYAALSTHFSLAGVSFSSTDAGSVFMMPTNGGL